MSTPKGRHKRSKTLSSGKSVTSMSNMPEDRYAFKNGGPVVSQKGPKLAGKTFNNQPSRSPVPMITRGPPIIETNVATEKRGAGTAASVSDITSAAEQFNNYRFNETAATKTYKKMMTIHLKDEMFGRLKFITKGEDLEFSRNTSSICSYVCTKMRVPDFQWGEYWKLVKQTTKKMIEQQRTNATSAIKKGFKGKSTDRQEYM
jgi:hypothetical protein